jgi:hypothetical protein
MAAATSTWSLALGPFAQEKCQKGINLLLCVIHVFLSSLQK